MTIYDFYPIDDRVWYKNTLHGITLDRWGKDTELKLCRESMVQLEPITSWRCIPATHPQPSPPLQYHHHHHDHHHNTNTTITITTTTKPTPPLPSPPSQHQHHHHQHHNHSTNTTSTITTMWTFSVVLSGFLWYIPLHDHFLSYSVLSGPALGKAAAVPDEAFQWPFLIDTVAKDSWN